MGPRVLLVTEDPVQREIITSMVIRAPGAVLVQSSHNLSLAADFAGHISLVIVAVPTAVVHTLCARVRTCFGATPIIAVTDSATIIEGARVTAAKNLQETFQACLSEQPDEIAATATTGVNDPDSGRYLRRILVKRRAKAMPIRVETIIWIEGARNYVRLHTTDDKYLFRSVVGRLQQDLDPNMFQRINRSVIVNMDWVRDIRPDYKGDYIVALAGGLELKLTRAYRDAVFGQFLPEAKRVRQIS